MRIRELLNMFARERKKRVAVAPTRSPSVDKQRHGISIALHSFLSHTCGEAIPLHQVGRSGYFLTGVVEPSGAQRALKYRCRKKYHTEGPQKKKTPLTKVANKTGPAASNWTISKT